MPLPKQHCTAPEQLRSPSRCSAVLILGAIDGMAIGETRFFSCDSLSICRGSRFMSVELLLDPKVGCKKLICSHPNGRVKKNSRDLSHLPRFAEARRQGRSVHIVPAGAICTWNPN